MPSSDDFTVERFAPAYLADDVLAGLPGRVGAARESLRDCQICPRHCGVNRLAGETKVCHTARLARVTSAFAHMGEESCLTGWAGSGTIFFGRCNLRCVFCQNADISQTDAGRECTADELADIMLALQNRGCHNINFVTPEHVVPQVIEAVAAAIGQGLRLPIVYNTGTYDSPESIRRLADLVDIYMPDFKLFSPDHCARYLGAKDYADRARQAISLMHEQVGDLHFTSDGLACRGLLVRHLVMPGLLDESDAIFRWLADSISPDTFVNVMAQYHPAHRVGRVSGDSVRQYDEINRRPTADEIASARRLARQAGLWRFD